jgi:arylsulfatase A-like enzyme
MPSRATLATGRWPTSHGTRTNGIPLDPSAETLMSTLRRAGWSTVAVGKLHFQTMGWPFLDDQQAEIDATDPEATDPARRDAACQGSSSPLETWDWER